MALQPFSDEQLNFFKFSTLVLNEFPKALRQTFKTMWNNSFGHRPGFLLWNDSTAVRNMFATTEGGKTKVPVHQSYNEWDCTNLFQATIFAQSFALPASTGSYATLSDLYVKPRAVPYGSFHACVVSPGNNAETFALAIDQLRLLRNSLCHSTSSEMDKSTFDQGVNYAKDAFQALGVPTVPIDALGSLTESDFPTNKVRKLELGMRDETRAYIRFLEGVSSDVSELKALLNSMKQTNEEDTQNVALVLEQKINALKAAQDQHDAKNTQQYESVSSDINVLKQKVEVDTASKEDINRLEKKIHELKVGRDERDNQPNNSGTKPSLSRASLPSAVPNFTGRQSECDEIISHVTTESTRLVSIWGSPGFGKTSVAIALGHTLQSQGLPVYWVSLRGLQSKADLTSKFLSLLRQPTINKQPSGRCLSLDDEICQLFSEISKQSVFILDNADDLLESGWPKVKEEVMQLLEEILRQNARLTFVVTTRESLEFMDVHFQGHQGTRIRKLDEAAAQTLVHELLPNASAADCTQVAQICGQVPLAMKLMCSLISEDSASPHHFLDDLMKSPTESVVQILDSQDYPTSHRLQFFFDSSFQRLTAQEQEALISLSILPENFSTEVAAAVLDKKTAFEAKRMLQSLRRKSLIDSSSKAETFKMHKLLQSFAREKGENDMKETILNSKSRLNAFYVSLFKRLNEQFLTGQSMAAYIAFYEDKESIIQSLVEGCSDSKTADIVFEILIKGEFFLDSLFWSASEGKNFDYIYDAAIKAAILHGKQKYHRQLLSSRAFREVTWGRGGKTKQLLSKGNDIQPESSPVSNQERGKYLCYLGIYRLVEEETNSGVQLLKEALSSLDNCSEAEQTILKLLILQIIAVYYQSVNDCSSSSFFYDKALHQCTAVGDRQRLIIPLMKSKSKEATNEMQLEKNSDILLNQPLNFQFAHLLSEATKFFSDTRTKQCTNNLVLHMLECVEREVTISVGLLIFHRAVVKLLWGLNCQDPVQLYYSRINYHQKILKQCKESFLNKHDFGGYSQIQTEALVKCFLDLGKVYLERGNYSEALQSTQQALDIATRRFGEQHACTADSYRAIGVTQHKMHDCISALQSHQCALAICIKLFGEVHESTADSYRDLGVAQSKMHDYSAAVKSHQRALSIRLKLFGEEHESTAHSYTELGVTQHNMHDYVSALQSHQHALAIRIKLFGKEHKSTADSYRGLGVTQHEMHDYSLALQSHQRALAIHTKLFGEKHESTADSYRDLGVTQSKMHDYGAALQSHQRALTIRLKLFGKEHESTADSYWLLGVTQHEIHDYSAALQSHQRALAIRIKLLGEEHKSTAESYRELGVTQHNMHDYSAALQSHQRALTIRLKLFGEEHESTADSYWLLGVTQHKMHDYSAALQPNQRALTIRLKLFGEEHESTADSYWLLGVTQHKMHDYSAALQSHRRALSIRLKLFGEEHASTADSYWLLGVTQHVMHDYSAALQSHQRALAIRTKLFGEDHESTADSYRQIKILKTRIAKKVKRTKRKTQKL